VVGLAVCAARPHFLGAVELPRKDNTVVGAVLLTESMSLYSYQYMSLYAYNPVVRYW